MTSSPPPAKTPKNATSCCTTDKNVKDWNLQKSSFPLKTKKPQRDRRRAASEMHPWPASAEWVAHTGKAPAMEVPPRQRALRAPRWTWGLASRGAPRAFGFEGQRGLRAGAPLDGQTDSSPGRCTHAPPGTGTQGKAGPPQEPGPDLPAGLGGGPGEAGSAGAHCGETLVVESPGNRHQCDLSWRPPFGHQDLAPPAACGRQYWDGITAPPASRQAA